MEEIWQSFLSEDIGLPMITSLITGVLIGYEREMRGKAAGLRTHALVCLASTLVMLAAARQAECSSSSSPTPPSSRTRRAWRMAC